jgi:hypothetical protein
VAIVLMLMAVGGSEWLSSTLCAALIFWGGHVVALIFVSILLVLPLGQDASTDLQAMYLVRDVGPSAGFVCSMELLCARLPGRWRPIFSTTSLVALVILLFLPPPAGRDRAVYLSSALAHLLAFPLGWLSSGIGRRVHPDLPAAADTAKG